MKTPSWQDISINYSTEDEDRPQESRAVVCDINKEMLKVGKQKAENMGIRAGGFLTVKLLQVSLSQTSDPCVFPQLRGLGSMFTCTQTGVFGISHSCYSANEDPMVTGAWIIPYPCF